MASFQQNITKRFLTLLERRFKLVVVLTVLPIVAIGYVLVLQPLIGRIRDVGAFTLQKTEEQLTLKQDILVATESLVDKYDQLELDNIEKLRSALPSEKDLPGMFVIADALASASGLRLVSVSFSDTAAAARARTTTDEEGNAVTERPTASSSVVQKMTVNMHVSGGRGYEHLKQFLTNLESEIQLFEVQSVSYTPGVEGEEQYQINATTYYAQ